ncbi:MAG: copper amine oxidase N-terminal domain-containing protein [Clostridiales bacterium]|nr:copper amine oxidase N-terminal domain-containing protein [Clostridiales bacterium]
MKNLLRTALFALILMSMAVGVQAAAPASNLGGVNIDPDEARTEGHISITYGDGTKEEAPYNYVALLINGSLIKESNLVIENDRTLLPLRLVSETLGAEVGWDGAARKVTIKDAGNLIELVIGDTMAKVGGKSVALDVAPKIFKDYTYVPVRFVAESLGCEVGWYDGKASSATQENPIVPEAHYFNGIPQVMVSRYQDAQPLTKEAAVEKAREWAIKAFENRYGKYEPLEEMPKEYVETSFLRNKITKFSIKSESDRFYALDFVWEFWIDKYTGDAYMLYNGANKSISRFDPDDPGVLAFAG